ncbi:MAG: response regulator [Anaerolineae bacterium]|nr:response regulator [Anaerolineae bacterium]
MAGDKIRVMIVDDIPETREQLRKLLSFDPDIEVVDMAGSGEEALERVLQARPHVILMDINLPGIDGIATTGKILEVLPVAQVIMLSVQGESGYMRKAMMAGARDYLTKPPSADELLDGIRRAYKTRQKMITGPLPQMVGGTTPVADGPRDQGKIITIFSPKGGTGCTTIAVNLAIALRNLIGANAKIALVDGNLQFGDITVFMKLQATRTLADLAPHAQEIDSDLLNSVMIPHASGVKVLSAPASPEEAGLFQDAEIEESGANSSFKTILNFVRREYDYVIVDTAHNVDSIFLAAMDVNDLMLILTRPVIPEIRGARLFLELLQKLNYPFDNVGLVINSVENKRMGIQPEAIERAMMPALVHIPLDERTALKAANYGVPLIMQNAKLPIGQALLKLAQTVRDQLKKVEAEAVAAQEDARQQVAGRGRLL